MSQGTDQELSELDKAFITGDESVIYHKAVMPYIRECKKAKATKFRLFRNRLIEDIRS